MAFPFNMMSFWTTFVAFLVLMAAFFVGDGPPLAGWTAYAPLSRWAPILAQEKLLVNAVGDFHRHFLHWPVAGIVELIATTSTSHQSMTLAGCG